MGSVPSFRTWVAAEIITAAEMNANVRDGGNFMIAQPFADIYQATLQSIPSAAFTPFTFDASLVDSDGGHSNVTNPSRYTGKTAGWFLFGGGGSFAANATGFRSLQWAKNGSAIGAGSNAQIFAGSAGAVTVLTARVKHIQLNGSTDYVELQAFQTSGIALNTSVAASDGPSMTIRWVHS